MNIDINEVNGLFEEEKKYEVTAKEGTLVVNEKALVAFNEARRISTEIKELQKQLKAIEKPLKNAMKKGNVKSYKGDVLSATYVADTLVESVNVEKMKQDGIYEKYAVLAPRSGYVRITYKEEDK